MGFFGKDEEELTREEEKRVETQCIKMDIKLREGLRNGTFHFAPDPEEEEEEEKSEK